ncbi:MAG: LysR family transcriptional regulator [Pseudomonadota bacterium]
MVGLNFHHLRYFWAVAHEGNLTRTAERLNVSQSALSLQIKQLEERLGQKLFERRGRQLVLTEAGKIALDHADVIFSTGEELVDTLSERGTDRQRRLRVGALSTLSRNVQIAFLRPALKELGSPISVQSGSLVELTKRLTEQKLDVVLTNQVPLATSDTRWLSTAISQQPVSLIGAPERDLPERTLEEVLSQEPLIVPSRDSGIRQGFDSLLDSLGVTPNIIAEVDDMALLRLLAREKAALTLVPPIVVVGELQSGRLVEVAALPQLRETFYALTVPRRFPNPALKVLLERMSELAASEAPHA